MVEKKFLATVIGALMLTCGTGADASENMVMFKIHDIVPVKNTEGMIESCDYQATFFNNTQMTISNVSLQLSWMDEVAESTIEQEKKEAMIANRKASRNSLRRSSMTEASSPGQVTTSLAVPPLAPAKQITVKNKIKTDRCFLLLGQTTTDVINCKTDEGAGDACRGLFKFVSPEDADYYTEFSDVTYEEQNDIDRRKADEDKTQIQSMFDSSKEAVKRVSDVLNSK